MVPVLLAAGCGDGRVPVYPVTGRVFVKGQPADNAFVVLHPAEPAAGGVPRTTGRAGPDGSFRLTTYTSGDGAPAGRYRVTVEWRARPKSEVGPAGPDQLGGRYRSPDASKVEVTIGRGPTDLGQIRLD